MTSLCDGRERRRLTISSLQRNWKCPVLRTKTRPWPGWGQEQGLADQSAFWTWASYEDMHVGRTKPNGYPIRCIPKIPAIIMDVEKTEEPWIDELKQGLLNDTEKWTSRRAFDVKPNVCCGWGSAVKDTPAPTSPDEPNSAGPGSVNAVAPSGVEWSGSASSCWIEASLTTLTPCSTHWA